MVEFNSARIIREARQTKPYFVMTHAESDFVAEYPHLNGNEKFLWTRIAAKSSPDKEYSCILTQEQIARIAGQSLSVARKSISNLRKHGFLETISSLGGPLKYFLTLPQKGLNSILAVDNRKGVDEISSKNSHAYFEKEEPPIQNERPPRSIQTPPPSKMNDLYNNKYNNINNNKHNHDAHSDFSPTQNPHVLDADALICDFKNLIQEKYAQLPMFKRVQAALSHFTEAQKRAINERQLELTAITDGQKIHAEREQAQRFTQELAKATPVPASRPHPKDCKLVEFEFENEHFLVEEQVKNQILNQIPNLYQNKKILGEASHKPINTLMKEILFYVAKAGSKTLDACQLKRFHTARKLCQKGAWERPNGLERQASIAREQQWQQVKMQENRETKAFTQMFMQNVA